MWFSDDIEILVDTNPNRPRLINYCFLESRFGALIVGTNKENDKYNNYSICFLYFVHNGRHTCLKEVRKRWPNVLHFKQEIGLDKILTDELFVSGRVENKPKPKLLRLALYGTDFQLMVWKALLQLEKGETCTYAELAQMIGRPKAIRAVASAVGRNEISVLIPCHRVMSKNGEFKYHWGAQLKKNLLNFEDSNVFKNYVY